MALSTLLKRPDARAGRLAAALFAVDQDGKRITQLEGEQADHEKAVAQAHASWQEARQRTGDLIDFMFYPSRAEGRERGERTNRLRDELRAAREKLAEDQSRLRDAERMAKPLSEAARRRLQFLVAGIAADADLAEFGVDVPRLMLTAEGRHALVELAADFGVTAHS